MSQLLERVPGFSDRIAFVGRSGQVHIYDGETDKITQLTYAMEAGRKTMGCLWPLWSPNGKWVAYFEGLDTEEGALLSIAEAEGIEVRVVAELGSKIPIYAQWSPDNRKIAVLVHGDELEVWIFDINDLGQGRFITRGSPLFFNWTPQGDGLIVHSVHRAQGKSLLRFFPLNSSSEGVTISDRPGSFCTPVFYEDQLIFVEGSRNGSFVYTSKFNGENKRLITQMNGMVSAMKQPGSSVVAISSAPKGDGTPYHGVSLLDIKTGEIQQIINRECQSFWWKPDGSALILSQADRVNSCMQWIFWNAEEFSSKLGPRFWPTREQIFQIHFFEQFGTSHGSLSSDGRFLLYSGYTSPKTRIDFPEPKLFCLDLDSSDLLPIEMGSGNFGVLPVERPSNSKTYFSRVMDKEENRI